VELFGNDSDFSKIIWSIVGKKRQGFSLPFAAPLVKVLPSSWGIDGDLKWMTQ